MRRILKSRPARAVLSEAEMPLGGYSRESASICQIGIILGDILSMKDYAKPQGGPVLSKAEMSRELCDKDVIV